MGKNLILNYKLAHYCQMKTIEKDWWNVGTKQRGNAYLG